MPPCSTRWGIISSACSTATWRSGRPIIPIAIEGCPPVRSPIRGWTRCWPPCARRPTISFTMWPGPTASICLRAPLPSMRPISAARAVNAEPRPQAGRRISVDSGQTGEEGRGTGEWRQPEGRAPGEEHAAPQANQETPLERIEKAEILPHAQRKGLLIFCPHRLVESVWQIDPDELVQRGIRGVILDLDNTLVRWKKEEMTQEV